MINNYTKIKLENLQKKLITIIGILIVTIIIFIWCYFIIEPKKNDKYIEKTAYPVKACDYILENVDLKQSRFYNDYNFGSYMIYRGIPVFIDSRADLYAPEFSGKKEDIFTDFIYSSSLVEYYGDIFKKYNITHIITYANSKIALVINNTHDSGYEKLYSDDNFVIYKINN